MNLKFVNKQLTVLISCQIKSKQTADINSKCKNPILYAFQDMGVSELVTSLGDNPYFGAGFGLAGVGFVAAFSKRASQVSWIFFKRHCMTSVEVTCKDKSFNWLLQWMTKRGAKDTQHLSVETTFHETDSGKVITKYGFQPAVGMHYMKFNGTWIQVERTRENRLSDPWETVKLTALGRHNTLFSDILEYAREMAFDEFTGKTVMYTLVGTQWMPFGHPRQRRPLDSVVLPEGLCDYIVNDVKDFINCPGNNHALIYRRGC